MLENAGLRANISAPTIDPTYGFSEVRVETWPDARTLLRTFPISWIFRGQSSAQWLLSTSLERVATSGQLAAPELGSFFEPVLTKQFQSQAHNHIVEQQLPRSILEWWALMQHHGAPTRLLDWTESAYVAAFFALDTTQGDCAVWAVDRVWCRNSAANVVGETVGGRVEVEQIERLFDDIFGSNKCKFVFPVRPETYNSRLAIQQGLFLCPGSASASFMDNLVALGQREGFAARVVRIVLAAKMRANALHDLNYMNINRSTLFPGLDGFAESLRNSALFLRDIDDPVDDQAIVNGFPFNQFWKTQGI
jgi:hypothetical protein